MFINKVIIYGNLTRDPEIKALPTGNKVCSFSVATNRVWKDKEGVKKEGVDYHNIVAFGRQAELIAQYLKKGSGAFVEGRLQTRTWEDKATGERKYRTEVITDNVQFGPRSTGGKGGEAGAPLAASEKDMPAAIEYPEEEINPDDIPF